MARPNLITHRESEEDFAFVLLDTKELYHRVGSPKVYRFQQPDFHKASTSVSGNTVVINEGGDYELVGYPSGFPDETMRKIAGKAIELQTIGANLRVYQLKTHARPGNSGGPVRAINDDIVVGIHSSSRSTGCRGAEVMPHADVIGLFEAAKRVTQCALIAENDCMLDCCDFRAHNSNISECNRRCSGVTQ